MATTPKTYKFQATIESSFGGGACILVPYDIQRAFATSGTVPVKAILGGVPYTGSLMSYGGPHTLHVSKAIRQQTGKDIGDQIDIQLWKDEETRTLLIPANFRVLMEHEGLIPFFESLSYSNRKAYIFWLTSPKTEITKSDHLTKAIEMLKQRVKTPS